EIRPERSPCPTALDRMAGALDAGRPRRPTGVEQPTGHPVADEFEWSLRRSLDVERHAEGARIGDVIAERDRPVELRLSEPGERPPLLDRLAVEPGDEQERQDVRDAI